MTTEQALNMHMAVRYNLPNVKMKEAVDIAFNALRCHGAGDTNVGHNWIRVEDGKPADGQRVLIYSKHGTVYVAAYSEAFDSFHVPGAVVVTHWHPLPLIPPREVTE